MKKIKLNLLCLLGLTLVLNSCTSDLEVVPKDDDIFTSEAFFAQPGAYKKALAGVYSNFSLTGTGGSGSSSLEGIDAGTSQYGRCLWYLQDLTSDQIIWSYENDPGTRELQRNIWTAENPVILGMFSRAMVGVAIVNEFLKQTTPEKLSARGVTETALLNDIALYRKEARVARALAYYNMMDLFGKAPFITESDPVNFAGLQYDRQQLFTFIESELLALVPDLKAPRTNEYGRVDQAVARMILAKMYLNAQVFIGAPKYNECVTQCNAIIAGGYALNENYMNNFKSDNNLSSELIFTFQADGVVTQNYGPTTVMVNGSVGSLEQNGTALGVGSGGWGGAIRLRKQFVEKFDGLDFDYDARKTITGGGPRSLEILDIANRNQGYILTKYSNVSSTGVPGGNSTFVNTDFPLFRLADVYLMYAECSLRGATGATASQALTYVNALRERANGGNFANVTSGQLNLNFILDERARELYLEGHRRQDLIRFGKYTGGTYNWAWKGNGTNGIAISNNLKVFPIPSASLAANPNLTQNTGY